MYLLDLIRQANRNLWTSKIRTGLTVAAIFIGAFILVLTLSVGEGVKSFVNTQTEGFTSENTLEVTKQNGNFAELTGFGDTPPEYKEQSGEFGIELLSQENINDLAEIDGIEQVVPEYQFNLKYFEAEGKRFTTFPAVYSERMQLKLAAGNLNDINSETDVIVGYGFIKSYGVENPEELIGKEMKIVIEDGIRNEREYTVTIKAVLTNSFILNTFMLVGDDFAKQAFEFQTFGATEEFDINQLTSLLNGRFSDEEIENLTDQYSNLITQFAGNEIEQGEGLFFSASVYLPLDYSEEQILEVKSQIEDLGFSASSAEEQLATFESLISNLQVALGGFSAIAILAASFGVANTLLMSIYERTKEIGLMKALGMKDRTVFLLLAIEASVIGFWGSFLGTLGALGAGVLINNVLASSILSDFEGFNLLVFDPVQIAVIIFGVIVVTFLAGTLPAIKAMRLNPIEALRYE